MTDTPVAVALRFAQALWPHDPAPGSEAVAYAWGRTLEPYTVDELCPVFEALARTHSKMPPLATVLADVRDVRRKAELASRPLLDAPTEAVPTSRQKLLAESQRRADDYRERLIREKCRMEGQPSPERVAEIRAWAYEVGPIEAAYLRSQGVNAEVTQPKRRGGGLADAIEAVPTASAARASGAAEPTPEPLTATEWAQRWRTATDETRPSLAADIRALPEEMRDEIRQLVVAK